MSNLNIEVVKNGFIVYENAQMGMVRRTWVFNTPEDLAKHVLWWSTEVTTKEVTNEHQ